MEVPKSKNKCPYEEIPHRMKKKGPGGDIGPQRMSRLPDARQNKEGQSH